jgi:hypothetical protein
MRSRICVLFGCGLLALGAPACGGDDNGDTGATAPGTEVDDDLAERLYGTWYSRAFGSYHTWESDGTWYVVVARGQDPYGYGTYSVEDSIVTLDTDPDSRECPQTSGSYEVTFIDDDTPTFALIDDECTTRGNNMPLAQWERVETE